VSRLLPRSRRQLATLCALAALAGAAGAFERPSFGTGQGVLASGTIQVAFTPGDDAAKLIVQALDGAKKQVLVQAYSFTSKPIAHALIDAQRRGVDVQLIVDREQLERTDHNRIAEIAAGGVHTFIDGEHQSAHNKVMVIDNGSSDATVITGSYNFTSAAQYKNAENLLIIRGNKALSDAYARDWQRHRPHSVVFRRP
jgi:phosphatidylserine/phosphatidylglycerophosphate/cardiolipin synthase-like enzyme